MALDLKGQYDEAIARTGLDRVRVGPMTTLLGGIPSRDVATADVLRQFGLGLFEAGGLESPLYGIVSYQATGAPGECELTPPAGFTWRVRSVGAYVAIGATNVPDITTTSLCLGLVSPVISPNSPTSSGTIAAPEVATGNYVPLAAGTGPVQFQGTFIMRDTDTLILWHDEAAGGFATIAVAYLEVPGSGVPPG